MEGCIEATTPSCAKREMSSGWSSWACSMRLIRRALRAAGPCPSPLRTRRAPGGWRRRRLHGWQRVCPRGCPHDGDFNFRLGQVPIPQFWGSPSKGPSISAVTEPSEPSLNILTGPRRSVSEPKPCADPRQCCRADGYTPTGSPRAIRTRPRLALRRRRGPPAPRSRGSPPDPCALPPPSRAA